MKNYILETGGGDTYDRVAKEAALIASTRGVIVEFEFNGVKNLVDRKTNLDWLYRDYANSWLMGWKEVGPNCVEKYSPEVQKEFEEKTIESNKKREEQEDKWQEQEARERAEFEKKVNGVTIELRDEEKWNEFKAANTDPYGGACVEYAESWARLMQAEFANGKKIADCAKETSFQLGFMGITGFMYGCAVSMLSQCWAHGEALRLWHNLDSQIGNEGEKANESGGTLNPALLTFEG